MWSIRALWLFVYVRIVYLFYLCLMTSYLRRLSSQAIYLAINWPYLADPTAVYVKFTPTEWKSKIREQGFKYGYSTVRKLNYLSKTFIQNLEPLVSARWSSLERPAATKSLKKPKSRSIKLSIDKSTNGENNLDSLNASNNKIKPRRTVSYVAANVII